MTKFQRRTVFVLLYEPYKKKVKIIEFRFLNLIFSYFLSKTGFHLLLIVFMDQQLLNVHETPE